ncbi:MAG: glycosyltransferase family 4 protein [Lachnospiraceae bacterium]|nr:glycosyltransferase family 4 protein [Candidatus Minthocola equi]
MNVLFLSLSKIKDIDEHGIYSDLMREFAKNEHEVFIVSPTEKRDGENTILIEPKSSDWHKNVHILQLKTGNITSTRNLIEKGISTLVIEWQITNGIKKYFPEVKFDLVLYATPPITLVKPIKYIKKRDGAKSYLMLKDIFPQNAVDLGMMSTTGAKGFIYKYFRKKEKKLYAISDMIGCMSPANVKYVLDHNPEIPKEKVEVCPNAIEVQDMSITEDERISLRNKYSIPLDKKVFVYGGNLGKPQGIPFVIECLKKCSDIKEAFFLIVGSGTEYRLLSRYVEIEKPAHVKLMQSLPKGDYDRLVAACDVGMIFLDYRFTIPNFPSRLLAYMQAGLPVLACTDPNTDIGKVITEGEFGWWCESKDVEAFIRVNKEIIANTINCSDKEQMLLSQKYSVEFAYKTILRGLL